MKTKLTELLGIKYPVIQGGMAWVAECHLAAAASNAGGLGLIAAAAAPAEWVREQIRETKKLTDRPFGVNIMLMSPEADAVAKVILEEGVKVVTTGAGNPEKYMKDWKEAGIKVLPVVASVALARRMERCGADAVIAEGCEAGGHIGELTTMVLVPQVADVVHIPVVAAGGIADGRGMAAAFMLGAEGIQMGTVFAASKESMIHENYKNSILKAKDIDSRVTGRTTGHPIRVLRNDMVRKYLEMEKSGAPFEEMERLTLGSLRRAVQEGDVRNGSLMAGQIAGMIHEERSCEEIIRTAVSEAEHRMKGVYAYDMPYIHEKKTEKSHTGKIAFVYPGQGAQIVGMAQDFYEKSPIAKKIFDEASEVTGLDLRKICFEENELLDKTEYTQAAMVTACLAMTRAVESMGLHADITAGLSLGEYCAIAEAGGMSDMEAVRMVRYRGIFMEQAAPEGTGAMSAVLGLTAEKAEEVLSERADAAIANYNCPGQFVITGTRSAVAQAEEELKKNGARRILPLQVSGPFHSPLMQEAGVKLGKVLTEIEMKPLKIPYVANTNAEMIKEREKITDLLIRQVSEPVYWQQSVETMIREGVDTFIEIGPGKTLTGFLRKINREVKTYHIGTWEEAVQVCREFSE